MVNVNNLSAVVKQGLALAAIAVGDVEADLLYLLEGELLELDPVIIARLQARMTHQQVAKAIASSGCVPNPAACPCPALNSCTQLRQTLPHQSWCLQGCGLLQNLLDVWGVGLAHQQRRDALRAELGLACAIRHCQEQAHCCMLVCNASC